MDRSRVAIIIPAYNEENTIAKIVNDSLVYGVPLVINDGSDDSTEINAINSGAVVVSHENNRGYDAALNTGFEETKKLMCDYIITVDADGQHDTQLIGKFIEKFEMGYPLVLGVRNRKSRVSEIIFGLYTEFRFGVKDPLCGMKGYSTKLYDELGYFDSYNSTGTELMLRSIKTGHNFTTVNFQVAERRDKPRFGNSIKSNYKIIKSFLYTIFLV